MKTPVQNAFGGPLLLVIVILNLQLFKAQGQGTAFTYQGRLDDGGSPANGSYDLEFTLFAANTGGVALAGPVTNSAVVVTNGWFTTLVDFGPGVFTGASNWLEIAVSTNGANSFTTLVPRQQLTPVPYAVFAEKVDAGGINGSIPSSTLSGTYSNTVSFDNGQDSFDGSFYGDFYGSSFIGGYFVGNFLGNGSGVTQLNPAYLTAGTAGINITGNAATATTATTFTNPVADAQLSANIARLNGTNAFTGTNTFGSAVIATNPANRIYGTFTGDGGGLTNVSVSQLGGVLPLADLPPGVVTNGSSGVTLSGKFSGDGSGLTNLNGGGIVAGSLSSSALASNSITAGQLAAGAAAANLSASGQSGVAHGSMVLSSNLTDANLLNAGYVKLGRVEMPDSWEQLDTVISPSARYNHTAVWTGSEMLIWGGTMARFF